MDLLSKSNTNTYLKTLQKILLPVWPYSFTDFVEDDVYYFGGTGVSAQAGLLNQTQVGISKYFFFLLYYLSICVCVL